MGGELSRLTRVVASDLVVAFVVNSEESNGVVVLTVATSQQTVGLKVCVLVSRLTCLPFVSNAHCDSNVGAWRDQPWSTILICLFCEYREGIGDVDGRWMVFSTRFGSAYMVYMVRWSGGVGGANARCRARESRVMGVGEL